MHNIMVVEDKPTQLSDRVINLSMNFDIYDNTTVQAVNINTSNLGIYNKH